jgi:hypothetical protein
MPDAIWFCHCGKPAFSVSPGSEAEYATARDLAGDLDSRFPTILIRPAVNSKFRCLDHMPKRSSTQ